ncbi:predicted protein [Lichtheimia corymbifera JMRC:FSU:9682]|uniref:Uncharacterized protein n=1 Tax=Lichtheimia corymbifera JMRC:FSU:9682 TaxID=1263082 RepID=A0A068SGE2_9FUNG|nr:predicted protein [Lichtheimia corymbifera JMRC:FSU:9682]
MGLPDKIQVSPGENSPPDKTVTYASVLNDRETLLLPTSTSLNNPRQISDAQFGLAVGKSPVSKYAHGVIVHRTRKHVIAKVAFTSQKAAEKYVDIPISIDDDTKIYGSLPIPDEWDIVTLNLDHIPLYNRDILCSSLVTALQPFGQILQIGIYLEQKFLPAKALPTSMLTPNPTLIQTKLSLLSPTNSLIVSQSRFQMVPSHPACMPLGPKCHFIVAIVIIKVILEFNAQISPNRDAIIVKNEDTFLKIALHAIDQHSCLIIFPILWKTNSKFNLQATSKSHDPVFVADPPDNNSTSMDISLPPPSSSAPPIEDMVT